MVKIETAGSSMNYRRRSGYRTEGYLPGFGVKNAESIREHIMKKIKQTGGSGL